MAKYCKALLIVTRIYTTKSHQKGFMPSSLLTHPKFLRTKHKVKLVAERLVDQHISLAVTGLSGSGKNSLYYVFS
jgi:hypothetical protein